MATRPNERPDERPRRRGHGSRFGRGLLLLVVALIHLGLGLVLSRAQRPQQDLTPRRPIELLIVQERLSPSAPAGAATPPMRRSTTPRARPQRSAVAAPPADAPAIEPTSEAAASTAPTAPDLAAASAPRGSLLDTEATRRAIRQGTREALLSERAAAAMGDEPLSAEQKLAREMAGAGKSECLKGEFLGGGLGLLSLPFWALAEARGQCRR